MSEATDEKRSVVVEREIAHAPEKIWRALTQPQLIEEWLMKNDFEPVVGRDFHFRADWGSVECKILMIEPHKKLAYTWGAFGVETVVTWTLTPKGTGTHLRMEQTGFRSDQPQAYHGAQSGWRKFLENLDAVLERMN